MLKKLLVVGYCIVLCRIDTLAVIPQEKGENSIDRGHWSCSVSPELPQDNVSTDTRYLVGTTCLVNGGVTYVVPEIADLFPKVIERNTDKSDKPSTVSMTSSSFSHINETTYPRLFEASEQKQGTFPEHK